jgi:hypothetical protein
VVVPSYVTAIKSNNAKPEPSNADDEYYDEEEPSE